MHARLDTQLRLLESIMVSLFSVGFGLLILHTYATFTVVRSGYLGFEWNPTWYTIASGLIFTAVIGFFLPTRLQAAGDFALYLMFIIVYVPAMVIMPSSLHVSQHNVVLQQIMLTACMLLLIFANLLPPITMEASIFGPRAYERFLLVTFGIMMLPMLVYIGVPTTLPAFADVYEVRSNLAESVASSPSPVGYLFGWISKVVAPYLVAYGYLHRSRLLILAGGLGTLYLYGISGAKSVLFATLLIVAVIVGIRVLGRHILLWIMPGVCAMIISARMMDNLIAVPWFTTLVTDRAMITPGYLTGAYFDFFTRNPQTNWSYSFLSPYFDYPYDVTPPFLIGRTYFDSPEMMANVHLWAEGYANMGYYGMVLVTLMAGAIIWVFNSLSYRRSHAMCAALATVVAYSLASDSVFTSLSTHGVFLTLVFLAVSPPEFDPKVTHLPRNKRGHESGRWSAHS